DLRSDTVTRPTESMFEAMQTAPLGDDVLGDDPTVMRLEELDAELTGMDEALFVPSGTMGNQTAIASQSKPADAIILEEEAIHLDGARVFNASVALGVQVKEIAKHVDSVSFCLSKGLRSPVGSVLCGHAAFIREARHWRKRLGGGMRQAGILASCGLVSLTNM